MAYRNPQEMIDRLENALGEAQAVIQQQQQQIEILTTPPLEMIPVVHVDDETIVVLKNGLVELVNPKIHNPDINIEPGDYVKVGKTGQIVEVSQKGFGTGDVAHVTRITGNRCEVEGAGSGIKSVMLPSKVGKVEKGDRVILDPSNTIVLTNLGKEEEKYRFESSTHVTWADIGGLTAAKAEMREVVELPFLFTDIYKHFGKRPTKGVLLFGPPGCGKTLIAKATASAVAKVHDKGSVSSGFLYVKGPEILSKWVGQSEANVRMIFEQARVHKKKHGYPAVVFIDEAEAILRKRGTGISSDITDTIVPMFLSEWDGLDESSAVLLLATNRPDILDPAVVRDGRCDKKIRIGRPSMKDAADIFSIHLKNVPTEKGVSLDRLAEVGCNELFASSRVLYSIAVKGEAQPVTFTLSNICNGGMIAGIVDHATSYALRRAVSTRSTKGGVTEKDMEAAVHSIYTQNLELSHEDDLLDFTYSFKDKVSGVHKLRNGHGA